MNSGMCIYIYTHTLNVVIHMCTIYNVSLQNKMATILYLLFPYPERKNADIVATEKEGGFHFTK